MSDAREVPQAANGFPFDRDDWGLFAILDYAFQVFRYHWMRLTLLSFVAVVVTETGLLASGWSWQAHPDHSALVAILPMALSATLHLAIQATAQLAFAAWSLRAIAGQPLAVADLQRALRRLPQALIVVLLVAVSTAVVTIAGPAAWPLVEQALGRESGLVFGAVELAIGMVGAVALFYVGIAMMFTTLTLVDDASLSAWQALQRSWAMTEGQRLRLSGATLVIAIIAGSGTIVCGVGLFITVAYAALAFTCVYNALRIA